MATARLSHEREGRPLVITRLRPRYSEEQLQQIYAAPKRFDGYLDQAVRREVTLGIAKVFGEVRSVADLSCGDGWIIDRIEAPDKYRGDIAPGYEFFGPIEQTIEEIPLVDLFICTQTLEHLDDPVTVLKQIRSKTQRLVVSTPNGETNPETNPEHYWGWNESGFKRLLLEADFEPVVYNSLELAEYVYDFQIWACR